MGACLSNQSADYFADSVPAILAGAGIVLKNFFLFLTKNITLCYNVSDSIKETVV